MATRKIKNKSRNRQSSRQSRNKSRKGGGCLVSKLVMDTEGKALFHNEEVNE